ncbi:hypothetical protein [Teichococcus vastitatis]|nr:hypothetical protein [Pseudoroseomonas vastitatis]
MVPFTRRTAMLLITALATRAEADEAPPLSPAQIALFETPHLASITQPTRLRYSFRRSEGGHDTVDDAIVLEIRRIGPDGKHDVYPDFLTGSRRIEYPAALGFKGNPLLLFALDRGARELASATGGSMNWFRSRFRSAMLHRAELRQETVRPSPDAAPVAARRIIVTPYEQEPRARRFQAMRYEFLLSDTVPGGFLQLLTEVPAGENTAAISEIIAFTGSEPS